MSHDAGDVDGYAATLRAIHDVLAACPDLRPGPVVDDAFGRLVRVAIDTPDELAPDVLAHDAVRDVADDLRALCCEGERQLEIAWADRIAASADPAGELELFPYLANYRQLCAMEQAALCRLAGAGPERVAFVGSGPLPLTAFLLGAGGTPVDNVDRDHVALGMSRRVTSALGLTSLGFVRGDAADDGPDLDLGDYDLVVLAALVGRTPHDKARILRRLADAMAPGAVLVVRGARGLRTLIYPEVHPAALTSFDVLGTVHPLGEVINSVTVARKPHTSTTE
jgi:nicotianamine synthase